MESQVNKVSVAISKGLYDKVLRKVNAYQDEFKSVEEYIEFVLMEVVKDEDQQSTFTNEEEEELKNRLKSLGYI